MQQSQILKIGNAPCSWGTLEFDEIKNSSEPIPYQQMLDELVETGYRGTELGDWGYFPTDPVQLAEELGKRNLTLLGAFVPTAFANSEAHAEGIAEALKVSKLMRATADLLKSQHQPYLILADENGSDSVRTQNAGRITAEQGLSPELWETFTAGVSQVAHRVKQETGLASLFHHHCAGFVETPQEIDRFLNLTKPELVNLVFDCGHYAFGANTAQLDLSSVLSQFSGRISYVHFKDCDAKVAQQSRVEKFDYFEALKRGIFCELGKGMLDFPVIIDWLKESSKHGWSIVEQDILPGMGDPKLAAKRNRQYLKSLGI